MKSLIIAIALIAMSLPVLFGLNAIVVGSRHQALLERAGVHQEFLAQFAMPNAEHAIHAGKTYDEMLADRGAGDYVPASGAPAPVPSVYVPQSLPSVPDTAGECQMPGDDAGADIPMCQ